MQTIGFVGAGNMARALGGGIARERAGEFALVATDPVSEAVAAFCEATGGRGVPDIAALVSESDVLVLAIKPQVLPAVLDELRGGVASRHLVLSILAGATLDGIASGLGGGVRVVRAMPNTPALVGQGMTVLVGGEHASADDVKLAEGLFGAVGRATVVSDEGLLDAVTAVSGSGPGFLFAYAEALLEASAAVGLERELAVQLVQQTLLGSAVLWRESGETAEVLRQRVTSPGGTTQAGLESLSSNGFADVVRGAIEAATRRSVELRG